ncbi:hypothetical protein SAMN02745165_02778 [Malonomonas rubra DSM 5091]|uniref:Uncharacterized protein n=1 Tax=Malonomonas rubra DSM 5091 TaxID=1122189 RepID=A0A1M6KS82_MALRU|nr:hypothetical protein [Malonomonas rubra]SHJ61760.1 hypothetical protein SAMN02745165_02778 [Malonomonas rubra DSM 5091]
MSRAKTVRPNFSIASGFLEKIDDEFIQTIRNESGYNLSRSELIQILFELALDGRESIQMENVYDRSSLKEEIKKAISK